MNIQQNRTTALYCRLSRDDDFGGDSVSIQTQKTMLAQFARDNGFTVTEFYVDDGYSGTNFDRPDFCRMIDDIECDKIGGGRCEGSFQTWAGVSQNRLLHRDFLSGA